MDFVFDPFAENEPSTSSVIHIRLQKRTSKKAYTLVEGLTEEDYCKLLKPLRKILCASGTIKDNDESIYLQFQGDHRQTIARFLVDNKYTTADNIKIHGT